MEAWPFITRSAVAGPRAVNQATHAPATRRRCCTMGRCCSQGVKISPALLLMLSCTTPPLAPGPRLPPSTPHANRIPRRCCPTAKYWSRGGNLGDAIPSSELYSSADGTWADNGAPTAIRVNHTATLLPDGNVLHAGGDGNSYPVTLSSAELYDPEQERWTAARPMSNARDSHTATLLPNGKVLIAGGSGDYYLGTPLASAELYAPATRTWTDTGPLATARQHHTATLLTNGKVLVAGGSTGTYSTFPLSSASYMIRPRLYGPGRENLAMGGHSTRQLSCLAAKCS